MGVVLNQIRAQGWWWMVCPWKTTELDDLTKKRSLTRSVPPTKNVLRSARKNFARKTRERCAQLNVKHTGSCTKIDEHNTGLLHQLNIYGENKIDNFLKTLLTCTVIILVERFVTAFFSHHLRYNANEAWRTSRKNKTHLVEKKMLQKTMSKRLYYKIFIFLSNCLEKNEKTCQVRPLNSKKCLFKTAYQNKRTLTETSK